MIADKRGDVPRVTLQQIQDRRRRPPVFFRVGDDGPDPEGITTVCMIVMRNGFRVFAQSTPASPLKFDAAIGEQVAFDKAIGKVFNLEGYLLREALWRQEQSDGGQAAADTLEQAGR